MESNQVFCDCCDSTNLEFVYEPPTTEREIKIYVCSECSLLQSWPRLSGVYTRKVSVDGEAGWGRIRYGKRLNLIYSIDHIKENIPMEKINSLLDIGANRLYFLKQINKDYPHVKLTGIENDKTILSEEQNLDNIRILNSKFEDAAIGEEKFDFIHSSHTLEHVVSPKAMFEFTNKHLNEDGYIYCEVPKTESISDGDVIPEYFIDNHLFHFTTDTLLNYFNIAGFSVLNVREEFNYIAVIARKSQEKGPVEVNLSAENTKELVADYIKTRASNLEGIKEKSKSINKILDTKNVIFWGGARIFDIFYKYGSVEWKRSMGVIDKYLTDYVTEVNGVKLHKPDYIKDKDVDLVIVFSDEYFDEICEEAKLMTNRKMEVLKYSQIKG